KGSTKGWKVICIVAMSLFPTMRTSGFECWTTLSLLLKNAHGVQFQCQFCA
ncbi:hypothetical protein PanWU01x14_232440, partial [Parasponia andersonii]